MQDILIDVSLGIIGVLVLSALILFVYGQLSGYLTIRKIERMYNQEVMAEWLRERGASEE